MRAQIESLGTNLLIVVPGAAQSGGVRGGFGSASTLTVADAAAIAKDAPDVANVAYLLQQAGQVQYANKNWNHVSSDLQRGWSADNARKYGEWPAVSGYASVGFTRGRSALGTAANKTVNATATVGNKAANVVDDMKDRVDGNPASKPGPDATDSARRMDSR